jgi:hypothetical protein
MTTKARHNENEKSSYAAGQPSGHSDGVRFRSVATIGTDCQISSHGNFGPHGEKIVEMSGL